ncbi:hypothetical protein BVC80_441g249 [Macleaya cordata]|uniref:AB hydrolase-1 domain-containing protein n=1 Tax=Macleaya cordata TaxID=56857 RepID=A0A200Q4X0_MACCD|nr:hypothetical protein BVC80_441g249 [Macleaya cordata]
MAIITEEPEEEVKEPKPSKKTHKPTSSSTSNPGNTTSVESPTANAFIFWAYFTLAVSLFTLLIVSLSSLTPQDDKSWFLSLPTDLRLHYSKGRTIKVQTNPNTSPIEVFAIEEGSRSAETVLLIHGLGCNSYSFRHVVKSLSLNGIHAVAIDLPGAGFSDKSSLEEDERWGGIWDVYSDIKEKGLFWGFDHLIETGGIPYYEETEIRVSTSKSLKPLELKPDEMGRVIGQVIDSMGLAPVHLVLHDSAFGMCANWVSENLGLVSSLTLVDSTSKSMSLPLWVLEMPVVREIVLGFSAVYSGLLRSCCSRSMNVSIAEAHRVLLKGRDGRRAVVGAGKGLNYSFDLGEWAGLEGVKDVPIQVLWSRSWSEEWSEEGRWVADKLPQAKLIVHSGGRWPQEDAADEVTETITQFVSSLPKSVKKVEEEPVPEHIKKLFDEADGSDHHHHHHHHHDHHVPGGHDHHMGHGQPGYMDAYGLGHGWGS